MSRFLAFRVGQLTTEGLVLPVKRVTSAIAMAACRTAARASDDGRW